MPSIGVLHLEALDQCVADGGVLYDAAQVVEVGLGVQRRDGTLEALPVVLRAEVVQAGRGPRTVFELIGGERRR
jgi:hypothetical protein